MTIPKYIRIEPIQNILYLSPVIKNEQENFFQLRLFAFSCITFQKMKECRLRVGQFHIPICIKHTPEINGAEEVYNENNILIIEVRSFVANRDLNSNTSHCIASSQGAWDSYVGDNRFTKQYYIYNFNLPPSDVKSVIGITIGEGGRVTACHTKNDGGFTSQIESYMKSLKILS